MKAFKGYSENNERRTVTLDMIYRLLEIQNKIKPGSGDTLEENILDKHDAATLSELSTATLVRIHDNIMNQKGDSYGDRNERGIAPGSN